MKNMIIASAIASICIVSVNAQAKDKDIELFGILYIESGSVQEGNDAKNRSYTGDENGMGRIGVRGSYKLSDDLTLVGYAAWNMNMGDADDGNNNRLTITDRDHNIGFRGNFGEVRVGSFDGAYKATGGAKYDAFASTALQARGNGGMATGAFGTTSYFHNAMQYKTPDFNGFNATIQYSIDERDRSGAIKNYKGAYNVGLSYDFLDKYQVVASFNSVDTVNNGSKGNRKIGASAKFGSLTMMGQYEKVNLMGTSVRDLDIHFVGARYRVGPVMFVGQYGRVKDNDNSSRDETYLAAGGRYFWDRRTSAYFGMKNTGFNDDNKKDLRTMMVSVRHNF